MSEEQSTPQSPVKYRPISGFPAYRVGSDGTVQSLWVVRNDSGFSSYVGSTWRTLVCSPSNSTGYPFVLLYRPGKRAVGRYVHSLVLEAFVGPRPSGKCAAHNNGIRSDSRLENLRWATISENMRDKERHGTNQIGSRSGTSKFTESDIPEIDRLHQSGETFTAIGRRYGVNYTTIERIVHRKTWRHVPFRPDSPPDAA